MRVRRTLYILAAVILAAAAGPGWQEPSGTGGADFLNDRSRQIIGADMVGAPGFITPYGLTGRGQVVAVADSGVDSGSMEDLHPDLAGDPGKKPRIIMLKSWAGRQAADDPVGHGTHMVGTIAGSGKASGGKFKGVAPEASIYFQGILDRSGKISPPSDMETLFMPAYLAGARIHVNAWGSGSNIYSGSAMKADAFMRNYPGFLAIFGAGNSGPGKESLTSEANSKNALVVGSSVSPRPALDFSPGETSDTAQFSSRGPAGDGRIKPDLLAPGTSIISTRSRLVEGNLPAYPMYTRMQGSSMAAAVAAGSAALMREFLQREMAIKDPRASSLKAALINGASTPDTGPAREGFGVLDLAGSVMALKERTMVLEEENTGLKGGDSKKYKFTVTSADSPFKATLAWTDPEGNLLSERALVNNLDLSVTGPDGNIFHGNHFLGQAVDSANNVEQVYIKDPKPGEYIIEIKASSIKAAAVIGSPVPSQDYSLVYGQPLATGIIKSVSPGGTLDLFGGGQVRITGKNTHYILEGSAYKGFRPEPGYRVYYGGGSVYIAGRLWAPESVQYRESAGGLIWYEGDRDMQEGGYYQNPGAVGLNINGTYRENISGLPQGVGLEAVLDGPTQTLWNLSTSYATKKGNVVRVVPGQNGVISSIELFNDKREYRVSDGASYIYNDVFEGKDPLEAVFGSADLNGLQRLMAGQNVTLVMTPQAKNVNSILVDRSIVSGYVTGVDPRKGSLTIGGNGEYHVIAGSGVQKDRSGSSLKDLAPGDYAVAVVIPGTREILAISAYSNVVYGRVLFTSARDKSVYVNDIYNRFQIYNLSPETEVRRWGLATGAATLSAGTWVRITLSPDGKNQVWRMDVAELLEDEQKLVSGVDGTTLVAAGGERYRISPFTAVTKDGLPITVNDLVPGERVTVVSLLAPAPYNRAPVAIRARSGEGAKKPVLAAVAGEVNGYQEVSGYTSGSRLYIFHENGIREDIPVQNQMGAFNHRLEFFDDEKSVRLVAVDGNSGGVAGKTISRTGIPGRTFTDLAGHWAEEDIAKTAAGGIMAGYDDGTFRPDRPISRSELTSIWAAVSGSPGPPPSGPDQTITRGSFMVSLKKIFGKSAAKPEGYSFPFTDCGEVTAAEKDAITWSNYWGVTRGTSSSTFDPASPLTRGQAAAVIQRVLEKLTELGRTGLQQ